MPKLNDNRAASTLPGLDADKRYRQTERPKVISFIDKELGLVYGRGMMVVVCGKCGKHALERKTERGKVWEHVREYWVTNSYETKSRATQYCREIEADATVRR